MHPSLALVAADGGTYLVYALIGLIVLVGITMVALMIWLVRATKPEHESLSALGVMGSRRFRRAGTLAREARLAQYRRPIVPPAPVDSDSTGALPAEDLFGKASDAPEEPDDNDAAPDDDSAPDDDAQVASEAEDTDEPAIAVDPGDDGAGLTDEAEDTAATVGAEGPDQSADTHGTGDEDTVVTDEAGEGGAGAVGTDEVGSNEQSVARGTVG